MQFNDSKVTGTGTVTTNATVTLAGSSTVFLSEFNVGDEILVNGETRRTIATIASNTSLTVTSAFSTTAGSLTFQIYDKLDLYGDTRNWCGIDPTDVITYSLRNFTRDVNFGLDKVVSLIFRSDGAWKWDDTNQTNTLIATANLTANTQTYAIAVTDLKITKIRIKDQQGNWVSLTPKSRRQLTDSELTATASDPKTYFKLGNKIFLNPTPSYSSTLGFEVQFQRGASYFVYTDTTKTPGFATQFHRLISLYASLDYCEINDLVNRAVKIKEKIQSLEAELIEFYSSRANDEALSITPRKEDYGEDAL